MQKFLSLLLAIGLCTASAFAQPKRQLGEVKVVVDGTVIPVRVTSSSPELQKLAQTALNAHGAYDVQSSKPAYEFRFTGAGTQVRVDILKGSAATPVASETVTAANARLALLRAADIAVEKTNRDSLRGFFTAKLAFVGERSGKKELYTSDLFLGDVKQITTDRSHVLSPRWSPDGSRILYTSYFKSGMPDIFVHDLNSYQRSTFVSFKGTNMGARFSPSGQQVAMVLSGEGPTEIYVSNAQGRGVSRKTRSDATKSSPAWSPDGSRIVFAMEPGPQLYVMPANGGSPTRISRGFGYAAEPDWSRVGNKIACTVREGGRYQIAVMDANGGALEIVSNAAFDAIEPSWLADGRHLVYTARDRSTSVVCILDTKTKKSTPLTSNFGPALQANVWTQ